MNEFKNYMNEASLGRVLQHAQSGKAILTLTAFRGNLSEKVNKKRNNMLEKMIRNAGYGFNKVVGFYVEDAHGEVKEDSFFIVDNQNNEEKLKEFGIKACKMFKQDSVFFRTEDGKNVLIEPTGKEISLGTGFSPNKMSQFYSKIKGKSYVFESIEEYTKPIQGMPSAMLKARYENHCMGKSQELFEEFWKHQFSRIEEFNDFWEN